MTSLITECEQRLSKSGSGVKGNGYVLAVEESTKPAEFLANLLKEKEDITEIDIVMVIED